ncbi:hypothetical protein AMTRI_Chr08g210160 [Amborella trichopoda]
MEPELKPDPKNKISMYLTIFKYISYIATQKILPDLDPTHRVQFFNPYPNQDVRGKPPNRVLSRVRVHYHPYLSPIKAINFYFHSCNLELSHSLSLSLSLHVSLQF